MTSSRMKKLFRNCSFAVLAAATLSSCAAPNSNQGFVPQEPDRYANEVSLPSGAVGSVHLNYDNKDSDLIEFNDSTGKNAALFFKKGKKPGQGSGKLELTQIMPSGAEQLITASFRVDPKKGLEVGSGSAGQFSAVYKKGSADWVELETLTKEGLRLRDTYMRQGPTSDGEMTPVQSKRGELVAGFVDDGKRYELVEKNYMNRRGRVSDFTIKVTTTLSNSMMPGGTESAGMEFHPNNRQYFSDVIRQAELNAAHLSNRKFNGKPLAYDQLPLDLRTEVAAAQIAWLAVTIEQDSFKQNFGADADPRDLSQNTGIPKYWRDGKGYPLVDLRGYNQAAETTGLSNEAYQDLVYMKYVSAISEAEKYFLKHKMGPLHKTTTKPALSGTKTQPADYTHTPPSRPAAKGKNTFQSDAGVMNFNPNKALGL